MQALETGSYYQQDYKRQIEVLDTRSLKDETLKIPLVNQAMLGSSAHSVSGVSHRSSSNRKTSQVYDSLMQNAGLLANQKTEHSARSRSLMRGLESGKSRQAQFEEHIEKFNQLDPLLKGQTIEYPASMTSPPQGRPIPSHLPAQARPSQDVDFYPTQTQKSFTSIESRSMRGGQDSFNDRRTESDKDTFYKKADMGDHPYQLPQKTPNQKQPVD